MEEASVISNAGPRAMPAGEELIVLSGGSLLGNQPLFGSLSPNVTLKEPENTQFAGEHGEEDVFFAVCGMNVRSDFSGLVIDTGSPEKWNDGKGGYVTTQNVYTFSVTTYSHLSKIYVNSGDRVEKGEILGAAGSSGELFPGGACQIGVARN
jgi:hypothetical protein